MPDAQLPSAKRRLAALLRDEDYGPKLARLNRADERVVLDLIYHNRGREARQVLNDLDRQRRRGRTIRDIAKRYAGKPKRQRTADWKATRLAVADSETQFWDMYKAMVAAA